jgi:hypothetical protein
MRAHARGTCARRMHARMRAHAIGACAAARTHACARLPRLRGRTHASMHTHALGTSVAARTPSAHIQPKCVHACKRTPVALARPHACLHTHTLGTCAAACICAHARLLRLRGRTHACTRTPLAHVCARSTHGALHARPSRPRGSLTLLPTLALAWVSQLYCSSRISLNEAARWWFCKAKEGLGFRVRRCGLLVYWLLGGPLQRASARDQTGRWCTLWLLARWCEVG